MPWYKKSKKSRQPSQQPAALGIPAHIAAGPLGFGANLDLGVYPEGTLFSIEIWRPMALIPMYMVGVNNGGGSRITLLPEGSEDQRLHASGAATQTPEHESDTGGGCASHHKC